MSAFPRNSGNPALSRITPVVGGESITALRNYIPALGCIHRSGINTALNDGPIVTGRAIRVLLLRALSLHGISKQCTRVDGGHGGSRPPT